MTYLWQFNFNISFHYTISFLYQHRKPEPKPTAAVKKPEPAKPEPPKPAKTWGKAGSKKAEPVPEPEKKEEVTLKKAEPKPKEEETKKVEVPSLKPTPKTEKEQPDESKETVQLKPVKKEVRKMLLVSGIEDTFSIFILARKFSTFPSIVVYFLFTLQKKYSSWCCKSHACIISCFCFTCLTLNITGQG